MPNIYLETFIKSDIQTCFDAARSIDLHQMSTRHTNERAIEGRISGLIEMNETVTWRAKHLGVTQNLTSIITAFDEPYHFRDEMLKGAFKYIKHDHYFKKTSNGVLMIDEFDFSSPGWIIGSLFDKFFLRNYLHRFLIYRNQMLKEYCENK
jgi:ligand-binding SRPBCC domain-containing protein